MESQESTDVKQILDAAESEERIAARAYEIWLERCEVAGYTVHGTDVEDWLQAEKELALEGD